MATEDEPSTSDVMRALMFIAISWLRTTRDSAVAMPSLTGGNYAVNHLQPLQKSQSRPAASAARPKPFLGSWRPLGCAHPASPVRSQRSPAAEHRNAAFHV